MAMFTDIITLYNKISDSEWSRTVVEGVQWADKPAKRNENGNISVQNKKCMRKHDQI